MSISTREAYGQSLAQCALDHKDIFVLDADLAKSTKTIDVKVKVPERYCDMGIAEGNMVAVAAGLAASGKVVYASSFAMFLAGRAYEQIRNSVCYPKLNVKLCATHAGISVGEDGATHQCIEDLSLMRSIPNMKVFQPCDGIQTKKIIEEIYNIEGPCYVRLGRINVDDVYDDSYEFRFGKGDILRRGEKIALIATGLTVQECLKAATASDMNPTVINISTIKPIDKELILQIAKTHDMIISVEEHNIIGGLGSSIAEVLASTKNNCEQVMIGIQDEFGQSGKPKELLKYYGLDAESIVREMEKYKSLNNIL